MFTSNNTTDTKCNKTPVGPLQLMFLMEAFSILAGLISWPPENTKSTPPPVLSVMMDQVDLTLAELNPIWFTSISKLTDGSYPDSVQICGASPPWPTSEVGPPRSSLDDQGTLKPSGPPWLSLGPDGN